MIDYEKLMLHNAQFSSIRENLVPMTEWVEQVNKLELGSPFLTEPFTVKDRHDASHIYVAPYKFVTPLWVDVMQSIFPGADHIEETHWKLIGEGEYDRYYELLSARINSYMENTIPEDNLQELDNNSDIGVILHECSGKLFPFRYSELDSMMTVSYSMSILYFIITQFKSRMVSDFGKDNVEMLLSYYYDHRNDYDFCFFPQYKTEDGDDFYYPGAYSRMNDFISYSADDVQVITEYITNMLNLHAKVIVVK